MGEGSRLLSEKQTGGISQEKPAPLGKEIFSAGLLRAFARIAGIHPRGSSIITFLARKRRKIASDGGRSKLRLEENAALSIGLCLRSAEGSSEREAEALSSFCWFGS